MTEREERDFLTFAREQLSLLTGDNYNGDKIITADGAVANYNGKARRIILLNDTTFNSCYVDYTDEAALRGYNVAITAPAILCPGKDKFFTKFQIADGGQVQVIE